MRDFCILNEVVIKITDVGTNETREIAGLYNAVLDNFISTLNGTNPNYVSCKVGNGTAPTTGTMTTLSARIPIASPAVININTPTQMFIRQKTETQWLVFTASFTYAVNAFTGPLTEVGFTFGLNQGDSNTVQSRVLLQDLGINNLVIKSTDIVSIDYRFNVLMSTQNQVLNTTLNDNGTNKNVTITYIPNTKLSGITFTAIKDLIAVGTGNNIYSKNVGMYSNRIGLSSASATTTSIATIGNADTACRITIPASDGNWADGIAAYVFSNGDKLVFNPPIVKDSDTTVTLDLQVFRKPASTQRQSEMIAAIDYTQPIIDLNVNPSTLAIEDSKGVLTEYPSKKYMVGVLQGRAAVWTTPKLGYSLDMAASRAIFLTTGSKFSFKWIIWISGSSSYSTLLLLDDNNAGHASGSARRGINPGIGTLKIDLGIISGNTVSFSMPNIANQWLEFIIHVDGSDLKVYSNGVAIFTSNAFTISNNTFADALSLTFLAPTAPETDSVSPIDLFMSHFSYYDNYLVPVSGAPSTNVMGLTNRTMVLYTFENGMPTNTASDQFLTAGSVTRFATGGPNNLPYIRVVNGTLDILSRKINFGPTEDFTLEFDLYPEDTNYLGQGIVLDCNRSLLDQAIRAKLFTSVNSAHHFDASATATRNGTVAYSATNAWTNWVIVRRNESGVNKMYVFKDGALVQTVTYPTDSTLVSMLGMGRMFIGHIGDKNVSLPTLNYRLANLRFSKGVVDYFNVGGFVPPVGLKTELF